MSRSAIELKVERVCTEMLAFSMLLLLCSTAFAYHIGVQANQVDHALFHSTENLDGLKKGIKKMEAEAR